LFLANCVAQVPAGEQQQKFTPAAAQVHQYTMALCASAMAMRTADLTQSCQPLGRWIRSGGGLVGIVTSENKPL